MKNFIIIVVGLVLLAALLGAAYVIFDSRIDEFPSGDYSDGHLSDSTEIPSESESSSEVEENSESETATPSYDFTVEDADGNAIKLSEISGKPMVVYFWASWCGNSLLELPTIEEGYRKYGDAVNFVVVAIIDGEYETLDSAKEFLSKQDFTFPVYFDVNGEAYNNMELEGFPNVARAYLFYADGSYAKRANASSLLDSAMLDEGISIILP